jgi:bromodomain adjacent to zinc finger domain protein 1A
MGRFLAPCSEHSYQCYDSQPLHLSTFTLDELEHAIRHTLAEPHCQLIAEIHSSLVYNLRTVTFQRHSAVMSLMNASEDGEDDFGISIEELTTAMADVGNNWERTPLRHGEGREGWEESLVGCLKDVCLFFLLARMSSESLLACDFNKLSNPASGLDPSPFCA